jgi:hypothetical protein
VLAELFNASGMKPLVVAFAVAGCTFPIQGTSRVFLTEHESQQIVPRSFVETEQLVNEKLAARGFTLVTRDEQARSATLSFLGNRDFSGASTIGSTFYAKFVPLSAGTTLVTLVGKPTMNHRESCPSVDDNPCTEVRTDNLWGLTGSEEANVIRGVFAEIELDTTPTTATK